jgi:hypothetical protein
VRVNATRSAATVATSPRATSTASLLAGLGESSEALTPAISVPSHILTTRPQPTPDEVGDPSTHSSPQTLRELCPGSIRPLGSLLTLAWRPMMAPCCTGVAVMRRPDGTTHVRE